MRSAAKYPWWAVLGLVAWLGLLPACGGGSANYEMAYGAQPTPMDQQDAQLRMLVEQDMRGGAAYGYATGGEGGAGGGAAPMAPPPEPAPMGYADVAESEQISAVQTSGGGWSRHSEPPPPGDWDAPASTSPSASAEDAMRQTLRNQVQGGQPQLAQNDAASGQAAGQATDAVDTSGPLLIYTAILGLAVHQVPQKQDRVEEIAREAGGFLASRSDDTIVVRVPARQFQRALDAIQELGDVVTRRVDVQDVSEEFRDVQTRIHTLELMRARVEQLLAQANDVEAALAVEQHLERITVELEALKGRLRFLSDRVAYSTITVRFAERTQNAEPQFNLPFRWLQQLGLDTLISL